ncbi:alpha/beta hydrolase [Embleya sp. MST-111070]|uniref:alpha/beta hydrolase n=1 Tax=Embleya sp. MST-111070 TaxID=3398231 RepID=UPI003F73467D
MGDGDFGGLADGELAAYVDAERLGCGPSVRELGVVEVRRRQAVRVAGRVAGPGLAEVRDVEVGRRSVSGVALGGLTGVDVVAGGAVSVRGRLYRPTLDAVPLVVYVHGGMWSIGGLESHDRLCRRLAVAARVAVLAVDYRLAPEHPWPAGIDDAVAAFRWAAEHAGELCGAVGVPAIAGDSSGGHLAALVCLRMRDAGGPMPAAQFLAFPNTDLTLSRPSTREKATGWGLTTDAVAWGVENLVPDPVRRADPGVSPLFAADLAGLPPAVVVTAEHDPLRDEGDEYADRLRGAGVRVRHRRELGMVHGFLTMELVSPAADAAGGRFFADVADFLLG